MIGRVEQRHGRGRYVYGAHHLGLALLCYRHELLGLLTTYAVHSGAPRLGCLAFFYAVLAPLASLSPPLLSFPYNRNPNGGRAIDSARRFTT